MLNTRDMKKMLWLLLNLPFRLKNYLSSPIYSSYCEGTLLIAHINKFFYTSLHDKLYILNRV